ncbi:DUF7226 domain-containing protein [Staphylococcus gallinarum]|uniref:DUF7226 domain-containing protein n=1 Tax=Staphylococcus gallinarum TaxID=1293 RepID=UPI003BAA65F0
MNLLSRETRLFFLVLLLKFQFNHTLADEIISHKPFYLAFKHYIKNNEVPNKSETVNYMKQCNIYNVGSDVTRVRRSSTIRGWIRWIANLTEEISR